MSQQENRKLANEYALSFINGDRNSTFGELKKLPIEKAILITALMMRRFRKLSTKKNNYTQDFVNYLSSVVTK